MAYILDRKWKVGHPGDKGYWDRARLAIHLGTGKETNTWYLNAGN